MAYRPVFILFTALIFGAFLDHGKLVLLMNVLSYGVEGMWSLGKYLIDRYNLIFSSVKCDEYLVFWKLGGSSV